MSERIVPMKRTELEKLLADLEAIEVKDGQYGFSASEVREAKGVISSTFAAPSRKKLVLTIVSIDSRSITARSLVKLLPQLRALVRQAHNDEEIACDTNTCRLGDSSQMLRVSDEIGSLNVRSAIEAAAPDYSIFSEKSMLEDSFKNYLE